MKKLVILRGNSGSGKTTVARALQRKIGFNTMLISQDEIRRNMLWVKDGIDTKALPLMIELLKYGNEHSDIVILEGIMYDEWYNPLFNVANELYGANVYSYYFNIPFEETVRRHQTRSKSQEFGEEHIAWISWINFMRRNIRIWRQGYTICMMKLKAWRTV